MRGARRTRLWIFVSAASTVSLSLMLGVLRLAGPLYLWFAVAGGALMVFAAAQGLERRVADHWPRRMQRVSVVYLLVLAAGLSLDWLVS